MFPSALNLTTPTATQEGQIKEAEAERGSSLSAKSLAMAHNYCQVGLKPRVTLIIQC